MSTRDRLAVGSRITAAVVGSLLLAMIATICLALVLEPPFGVALAVLLAVPLWLAAMVPGFLARSHIRAWLGYLGITTALIVLGMWLARLR